MAVPAESRGCAARGNRLRRAAEPIPRQAIAIERSQPARGRGRPHPITQRAMFTDVTPLLRTNPPALHYGVVAADLDGDGACEFFVCGYGGPNRLLKWDGRQLVDVADAFLSDTGRQAIGAAAG